MIKESTMGDFEKNRNYVCDHVKINGEYLKDIFEEIRNIGRDEFGKLIITFIGLRGDCYKERLVELEIENTVYNEKENITEFRLKRDIKDYIVYDV